MAVIVEELRGAIRAVLRRRGLAVLAVSTLALGIGLTTTMFGIVNGVVLRGLPVERPTRLLYLERTFAAERTGESSVPVADYLEWRRAQRSFEGLAAFQLLTINVSAADVRPERYSGAIVTANLFDVLGVAPVVGRGFLDGEDRPDAPPVAVVSHRVWRDHLGGAASLQGLTLRANGEPHAVVGVMPERFGFPLGEDIWIPMRLDEERRRRDADETVEVIGRLAPAVTVEQARAEMTTLAANLAALGPSTTAGGGVVLRTHMSRYLGDQAIGIFYSFLVTVVGVLLIAATNVTNLLLALWAVRARDMAVRAALGATRGRLRAQLLLESLVLASAGGLVGLGLARVGIVLFTGAIRETNPPFWVDIRLGTGELLFTAALVGTVTLVAGAVPALRAARAPVSDVLRDEGRGVGGSRVGRLTRALVMTEVALSFVLLVATGLMVRSVASVAATDYGFSADDVMTGAITLPASTYLDSARGQRFWDGLTDRLARQPDVRAVALTSNLPGTGTARMSIGVHGPPDPATGDYLRVRALVVSPGFFDTFDLRMVEGREFGRGDSPSSEPVVIVSPEVVDRVFDGRSPVGRRLFVSVAIGESVVARIVGVAPKIRLGGVRDVDPQAIYVPLAQHARQTAVIAVRSLGEPEALAAAIRNAAAVLDPDLPVYALGTMREALHRTTWFYGVFGVVFVVFGVVALVMVVAGVYGLTAFSVARRTREIGVRMAMGAQRAHVVRLVLGQTALQLAGGLAVGLILATQVAGLIAALLVGVPPRDPVVLGSAAAGLVALALLACLPPVLRAVHVNPTDALRHD